MWLMFYLFLYFYILIVLRVNILYFWLYQGTTGVKCFKVVETTA